MRYPGKSFKDSVIGATYVAKCIRESLWDDLKRSLISPSKWKEDSWTFLILVLYSEGVLVSLDKIEQFKGLIIAACDEQIGNSSISDLISLVIKQV